MKKAAIILFLLPVLSFAQADADSVFIKKMSDDILRNGKAHDLLRQLTKQVGGRLAGSPQSARAVSWGKFTMEMVAPDRVFIQQCMCPLVNGMQRLHPQVVLAVLVLMLQQAISRLAVVLLGTTVVIIHTCIQATRWSTMELSLHMVLRTQQTM